MIKYYLVPAIFIQEDGQSLRVPKYMDDLKLNWSGVYIESRDCYVLVANSQDNLKHISLASFSDVVELDGTKETKNKLEKDLKIPKIKDNEDEVEIIAKLQEPNFTKDKIKVVGD